MMSSEFIPSSRRESQGPEEPSQLGPLTAAQRHFAQVVGQALAEAWRRHLQHVRHSDSSSDRVP